MSQGRFVKCHTLKYFSPRMAFSSILWFVLKYLQLLTPWVRLSFSSTSSPESELSGFSGAAMLLAASLLQPSYYQLIHYADVVVHVMKLVLIPQKAFYLFGNLYNTVHFEVSRWHQNAFLQNGLSIWRFWMPKAWNMIITLVSFDCKILFHYFVFCIAIFDCTPSDQGWLRATISTSIINLVGHSFCTHVL